METYCNENKGQRPFPPTQSFRNNQNVINYGTLSESDVGTSFNALQKLHFTSV